MKFIQDGLGVGIVDTTRLNAGRRGTALVSLRGYWCRSTVDEDLNTSPRPCARKYGFNVHFNLLYDHGVNPTVSYLQQRRGPARPRRAFAQGEC